MSIQKLRLALGDLIVSVEDYGEPRRHAQELEQARRVFAETAEATGEDQREEAP